MADIAGTPAVKAGLKADGTVSTSAKNESTAAAAGSSATAASRGATPYSGANRDFVLNFNSPEMQSILREVYLPAFEIETFDNAGTLSEAFAMKGLGKTVNDGGDGLTVQFRRGTIGSVGSLSDGLTLGKASIKMGGNSFKVKSKGFQANVAVSVVNQMKMQASGFSAFDLFQDQFGTITQDLKRQYARQLYGDGSGLITTVDTAAAAGDIIDYSMGAQKIKAVKLSVKDIRPFVVGDLISFNSANFIGMVFKVLDVDFLSGSIVINAKPEFGKGQDLVASASADIATNFAVGTEIYYNGANFAVNEAGEKETHPEINGLAYIVNDGAGAYYSMTARPTFMKPMSVDVATGYVDDITLNNTLDTMEMRNGASPDFIVAARSTIRSQVANSLPMVTSVRLADKSKMSDVASVGTTLEVEFDGNVIHADRYAPVDKIYLLDTNSFGMVKLTDLRFDDMDGNIWKQQHSEDGHKLLAYTASMFEYRNLYSTSPQSNAVINIKGAKQGYAIDQAKYAEKQGLTAKPIFEVGKKAPVAAPVTGTVSSK